MASAGTDLNASQFYITTRDIVDTLDERKTIFGQVAEGFDVLERIDAAYCDEQGRPWVNMRVLHTIVLDDPFDDPPGLEKLTPGASPPLQKDPSDDRMEDDWRPEDDERDPAEVEKENRRKEAKSRAVVLEMIGDLPEADAKPPDNQLFVCKLNQVTTDDDLEIIFSRFGKVTSCDIVRDYKTGDSLCYAFITFDKPEEAEAAYLKMDNILIDDRRVHVDFSQSMHGLWQSYKKFGKKGGRAEDGAAADRVQGGGGRGGRGGGWGRGDGSFQSASGRQTMEYRGGSGMVLQGMQFGSGPAGGGGRGGGSGRGGEPRSGGRGPERAPRAEDWPCPRCANLCFGFRTECNRCGTAKGAEVEPPREDVRGRGQQPPHGQREGGRETHAPPPPRDRSRERKRDRDEAPREQERERERGIERPPKRERSRSREAPPPPRSGGRGEERREHGRKEDRHRGDREKRRSRSRSPPRGKDSSRRRDDEDRDRRR